MDAVRTERGNAEDGPGGETSAGAVSAAVEQRLADATAGQTALNAFSVIDEHGARAAAAKLDAEARDGAPPGTLRGVVVGVKDILDVAGLPTRWGSRLMTSAQAAGTDATSVARARAAGAVILGKTTTTEFAHSMMGRSPTNGLTLNPWNPAVTCGGSSAGAGVAVAAGLVDLSIATDAGASTRLPAACTGVFGLKPTLGRVPHDQVPEGFANFIHIGLLTRTVAELATALDTVSGPSAPDPHSLGVPPAATARAVAEERDLKGVRIACLLRAGNARVSREVEALTRETADHFAALGATVAFIDPELDNPEPAWRVLQQSNWASRFGARIAEIEGDIDASFATGIREGQAYTGPQLQAALVRRTAFFRQIQKLFGEADFLLTPAASRSALAADHPPLQPIEIDGEVVGDMRREWTPYLSLFDLTGHPALSIPAGFAADGSPLGMQLVARWYEEDALLATAACFERRHPLSRKPAWRAPRIDSATTPEQGEPDRAKTPIVDSV